MAKYRFILSNGSTTHNAIPIWKSDMAKEYAFEQGKMFRRANLSDALVFLGDDYDFIMSQAFTTKILITIQADWQENGTFVNYWNGSFCRTDCTINTDDHSVKVKPTVEDRYTKILAGLDNEYDLIKLAPALQSVKIQRRPMLQVYTLGESIASCFLGGMFWEQDVIHTDATDNDMTDTYHFGKIGAFTQVSFGTNPPAGLTTPFRGVIDHGTINGEWSDLTNNDGVYYMTYFQSWEHYALNTRCTNGLRIKRKSDNAQMWFFSQDVYNEGSTIQFLDIPASFTMTHAQSGYSDLEATGSQANIYGRLLLAMEFESSFEIPDDDVVGNNRNYRFCYPYAEHCIKMTDNSQAAPTEWGKRPDGRYYIKPTLTADERLVVDALYPVARSTWQMASVWLEWTNGMTLNDHDYRTPTTLRNAYMLEDVISALLTQIDSTLSFAADTAHSEFFYSNYCPLSNDWGKNVGRLMLTPKSNIVVAEYSQPAQKAPVKLKDILDMLQKAFGCYWYIDGNNLRIEHITYFKNGKSYNTYPVVGIDVTQMYNSRNGHSWALGTGECTFDKMDMPARYEYAWMDETTDVFSGQPIEVNSPFVEKDKVEEVNISQFNPDVDYIMLNPSNVSKDGFALLCAKHMSGEQSANEWVTQFHTYYDGGGLEKKEVQNYQLAMIELQPDFLISDMPAWSIKVNGNNRTAKGIQRKKKQQIKVPVGSGDGDMDKLVRTTVGDGEIERVAISLTSRMAKFTLRFNTTE